jgi:hypothetical protein
MGQADNLRVERKPRSIEKKETYLYQIRGAPGKEIGVITGDIQNIKEVDVWVNSENTNMQMSRPFERSISGTIATLRKKDRAKRITKMDRRRALGLSMCSSRRRCLGELT